jgi:hypothetical protein
MDVIHLVQDRVQRWALLNTLMNPQIPKLSDASNSVQFSLPLCVCRSLLPSSSSSITIFVFYLSFLCFVPFLLLPASTLRLFVVFVSNQLA